MIQKIEPVYDYTKIESEFRDVWSYDYLHSIGKNFFSSKKKYNVLNASLPINTGDLDGYINKIYMDAIIKTKQMFGFNVEAPFVPTFANVSLSKEVLAYMKLSSIADIITENLLNYRMKSIDLFNTYIKNMSDEWSKSAVVINWNSNPDFLSSKYVNKVWNLLKILYGRGRLKYGFHVIPWCSNCRVDLTDDDMAYSVVEEVSYLLKVYLKKNGNEFLVIRTTEPWNIANMMAIAINPSVDYVRIEIPAGGGKREVMITSKKSAESILKNLSIPIYKTVDTIKGESLSGMEYIHPLSTEIPYYGDNINKRINTVILSDMVADKGTGIAMVTPAIGKADELLGEKFGLPAIQIVDDKGAFSTDVINKYAGFSIQDASSLIIKDLKEDNNILYEIKIKHKVARCSSCNTKVIYRKSELFYMDCSEYYDILNKKLEQVNTGTVKETIKGTYTDKYWIISSYNKFGVDFPAWRCTRCKHVRIMDNLDDLKEAINYNELDKMDVNVITDKAEFRCADCGGVMNKIRLTVSQRFMDVLLQSLMSENSFNTPFIKSDTVESTERDTGNTVIDLVDNKWHIRLGMLHLILTGDIQFKNIVLYKKLNIVGDDGKESIAYRDIIDKYGHDILRYSILKKLNYNGKPFLYLSEIEKNRKFIQSLWSCFNFAITNFYSDEFTGEDVNIKKIEPMLEKEDVWIISKLEKLKSKVYELYEKYEYNRAIAELEKFVINDLSRRYIRIIKNRLIEINALENRKPIYQVLYTVFIDIIKMLVPVLPYLAEKMYKVVNGNEKSVTITMFSPVNQGFINEESDKIMDQMFSLVSIINKKRHNFIHKKLRYPIKRCVIRPEHDEDAKLLNNLAKKISILTNVKKIEIIPKSEEWDELEVEVIPNPNAISAVYRQWAPKIGMMLRYQSPKKIKEGISKGVYVIGLEGTLVKILPSMVSFNLKIPKNIMSFSYKNNDIYIDNEDNSSLKGEYIANDLIHKIEVMRRDLKLEYNDYIDLYIKMDETLKDMVTLHEDVIKRRVTARKIDFIEEENLGDYIVQWLIDNNTVIIGITPIYLKSALSELLRISGLSPEKAKLLIVAGYTTLDKLKHATVETLMNIPGISRSLSIQITSQASTISGGAGMEICPSCGKNISTYLEICPYCQVNMLDYKKRTELFKMELKERQITVSETEINGLLRSGYSSIKQILAAGKDTISKIEGMTPASINLLFTKVEEESKRENMNGLWRDKNNKDIKPGTAYLVKEEKPTRSYEIFYNITAAGMRGLCVTREFPEKLKMKYGFKNVELIWLSNIGKEGAVRPKDLEKLSLIMEQFLSGGHGIILLDGFEYLVTNNTFITILKLIQSIKDQIAIYNSIFVMPISPSTFDTAQLTLLEREVDEIL